MVASSQQNTNSRPERENDTCRIVAFRFGCTNVVCEILAGSFVVRSQIVTLPISLPHAINDRSSVVANRI